MLSIIGNDGIELTQGNSGLIEIELLYDDEPYIPEPEDKILFTVKDRIGRKILQKVLTDADYDSETGAINCFVEAEETIKMDTGTYMFDVLVMTGDNQVATPISSKLRILEAVGLYTDLDPEEDGLNE